MTTARSVARSVAQSVARAVASQGTGGGLPSGFIGRWSAVNYDATTKSIRNSASAASLGSYLTRYPRGAFVDTGALASPWLLSSATGTAAYAAGPDGAQLATRVQIASTGYLVYNGGSITLPAGTYTMVAHVKCNTGTQNFQMSKDGNSTFQQFTATTSWQQFKYEFTLGSSTSWTGTFLMTVSGAAGDFCIDNAFLWAGASATVPASPSYGGHLYLDISPYASNASVSGGELTLSNAAKGSITFDSLVTKNKCTMIAVVKRAVDYSGLSQYRQPFLASISSNEYGVGAWAFGEYENESGLRFSFGDVDHTVTDAYTPDLFDDKYHIIAGIADADDQTIWLEDTCLKHTFATNSTNVSAIGFQVGGSSYGLNAFKLHDLVLYDRALSGTEYQQAVAALISSAAGSGITITPTANLVVAGIDSITATANSYFRKYIPNATRYIRGQNEAYSGSKTEGSTIQSLQFRLPFHLRTFPKAASGRKCIYTFLGGANDLTATYSNNATNYINALWAQTDQIRALGHEVGICTLLPSTQTGFNTARATVNTAIRAAVGSKCDFVIDYAADATIGTDAAGANATLYPDGVHPTDAVHETYLEPIYRAAVNARLVGDLIPVTLLLDTYTAAAAFSLRKLRTAYAGSCIRVRRSSDNTEQDIGFSGTDLDTASLLSFCGAGDGYVKTWYDQTGNSRHKTQSTNSAQPQIVSSGAMVTYDGKSTVNFPSTAGLPASSTGYLNANPISIFLVGGSSSNPFAARRAIQGQGNNWLLGPYIQQHSYYNGASFVHGFSSGISQSTWSQTDNELFSVHQTSGGSCSSYRNGPAVATGVSGGVAPAGVGMGLSGTASEGLTGYIAELIEFDTDQSSNRTAIETSIASFYGITLS